MNNEAIAHHHTERVELTHGFTIVEVVIALAIGGLIFTIVFAAIPRLQAARRDSERKGHAEEIAAAIKRYHQNTGELPVYQNVNSALQGGSYASQAPFLEYVDDSIIDPSDKQSYVRVGVATDPGPGQYGYVQSYGCNATGDDIESTAPLDGSILIGLERGRYCVGGI